MRFLTALLLAVCGLLLAHCASTEEPAPPSTQRTFPVEEAAPPSEPPDYSEAPPALDVAVLERALHRTVNRVRRRYDRAPLTWSDSLHRLAQSHSRDMAQRSYFSHTSPGGVGPAQRASRRGFPSARSLGDTLRIGIGENLFRTYRYDGYRDVYEQRGDEPRRRVRRTYDWKSAQQIARETVEGWLQSPPHRRGLLSRKYRRHGLGVALTEKRVYVTQNLF